MATRFPDTNVLLRLATKEPRHPLKACWRCVQDALRMGMGVRSAVATV